MVWKFDLTFAWEKKNLWQIGAASPTSILCSIRWVLEGMSENKDGNDKIRLVNSFSFHPANNNLSKLTKDSVFELGLHNIVIWVIYQLFTTGKPLPAQKPPEPLTFSPHRFWPTWTRKIGFNIYMAQLSGPSPVRSRNQIIQLWDPSKNRVRPSKLCLIREPRHWKQCQNLITWAKNMHFRIIQMLHFPLRIFKICSCHFTCLEQTSFQPMGWVCQVWRRRRLLPVSLWHS